jgi:D-alanine-D-alanine ligase
MRRAKIKVAIVYNEPQPEMYHKMSNPESSDSGNKTYFEVDNVTPMEEFEFVAGKLNNIGFKAYTLNIKDNLKSMLANLQEQKPDVIFNFIEIYKENSRLEMNVVIGYSIYRCTGYGISQLSE